LAQLVLLTGSVSQAARLGTLPFLLGDLLKVALAVLILKPTVSSLRARL
jgi:biotin transporter BioY